MTAQDDRIVASQNEARVLCALNRFGWLPAKSLGALLWQPWLRKPASEPDMQPQMPTASARLMAQHTLRRLYLARQVLRAQAPDGSLIYTLAEAGVRRLAQQLGAVPPPQHRERHRDCGYRVFVLYFPSRHISRNSLFLSREPFSGYSVFASQTLQKRLPPVRDVFAQHP